MEIQKAVASVALIVGVLALATCTVNIGDDDGGGTEVTYAIRDRGPAGGYIFYVNPNYAADGWRYLEAAPDNQSGGLQWYNGTNVTTGATGVVLGTGESNTAKIVAAQGAGSYAAQLCNDLVLGGCSDWFLPSKDELLLMRNNLFLSGFGNFSSGTYWSSSESDVSNASPTYFQDGFQYYTVKSMTHWVRAARAF